MKFQEVLLIDLSSRDFLHANFKTYSSRVAGEVQMNIKKAQKRREVFLADHDVVLEFL